MFLGTCHIIDEDYFGYLQRQQNQIDDIAKHERHQLPADLDYIAITTLSNPRIN
jgi:tRNA uridine 5-carboxymethylaminomethyl modification enzyme